MFVHNDGVVNKIYLAKVSPSLAKSDLLNSQLKVSKEYLFAAIDRFESAFLQIGLELWEKCEKQSELRPVFVVNSITYEALQNKRWHVVSEIAGFMEKDKAADEALVLMARINGWIARKHTEGLDAIKAEVRAFDVSAKDDLFRLARHSLLEEDTRAIALCKRLEKAKSLSLRDLSEWPLFEKLRENPEMNSWLAKLKANAVQKRGTRKPAARTKPASDSSDSKKAIKKPVASAKRNGSKSRRVPVE